MAPITPQVKWIPEAKRQEFMKEMIEEYRRFAPRIVGPQGLCDVKDTDHLVVVLQKA